MIRMLGAFFVFLSIVICGVFDAQGYTIRMTCRSKGKEIELCKKAKDEWEKKYGGKHKVEIVILPHASNECFALYQQWLSAETFDIDILQMDFPWIGVFPDHILKLNNFYKAGEIDSNDYFDAIKKNMYNQDGELVALPWYTDCGVMYYRKDLLEKYNRPVPTTWEELYETALYIQNEERKKEDKKNKFCGFVTQAKAFEILTCTFVETIDSFGGAIEIGGNVVVDSDQCTNAMQFFIKCIKNITNRSVLSYSEEDARGVFQSGNAVFMRNWPYAWKLMNEPTTVVAGKIGVMPIPPCANGGKPSGVLGGWFLVVSKYSKHPELAADLIRFLTDKVQQKLRALSSSYLPAFKSLYKDDEVLKCNPFFFYLYESLENSVTRPSIAFGKNYSKASSEIYNSINTILTESTESEKTERDIRNGLTRLKKKLVRILQKKSATYEDKKETEEGFFSRVSSRIKNFFGFGKNNEAISSAKTTEKTAQTN